MMVLDTHKDWRFAKNVSILSFQSIHGHDATKSSFPSSSPWSLAHHTFDSTLVHHSAHKMDTTLVPSRSLTTFLGKISRHASDTH